MYVIDTQTLKGANKITHTQARRSRSIYIYVFQKKKNTHTT